MSTGNSAGGGDIFQIDLAPGTVDRRFDFPDSGFMPLRVSADKSHIAFVIVGRSPGTVYVTQGLSSPFTKATFNEGPFQLDLAIDGTGSNILVNGCLYDASLAPRQPCTPSLGARSAALNRAGTVEYNAFDGGVGVINLMNDQESGVINLPEGMGGLQGSRVGPPALTPNGDLLGVLTVSGIAIVESRLSRPQRPFTNWTHPAGVPLDGIGGWIATGNDPYPEPGQLVPTYLYGRTFGFAGNPSAQGLVALVKQMNSKYAVFTVSQPSGTVGTAIVPFNWQAGRFYFALVYQLGPGQWGAWVYDNTAAAWVGIGVINTPTAWGELSPATSTTAQWYGRYGGPCSVYPRADVYFFPTYGYQGTDATLSTQSSTGTVPGECPAENGVAEGIWAHYRLGGDIL